MDNFRVSFEVIWISQKSCFIGLYTVKKGFKLMWVTSGLTLGFTLQSLYIFYTHEETVIFLYDCLMSFHCTYGENFVPTLRLLLATLTYSVFSPNTSSSKRLHCVCQILLVLVMSYLKMNLFCHAQRNYLINNL